MKKYVSIIVAMAMSCVAFGQSISEADFGKTKSGESVKLSIETEGIKVDSVLYQLFLSKADLEKKLGL